MLIEDAFSLQGGQTVFVGVVTSDQSFIRATSCVLVLDGTVIQQLQIEGEMLPAKRSADPRRSVSTRDELDVDPRELQGRHAELKGVDAGESDDVSAEVRGLIADVDRELELPPEERESRAPTHDLLWVAEVLRRTAEASERGERVVLEPGVAHLVIDGWSLASPLSDRLVEFARRHEP